MNSVIIGDGNIYDSLLGRLQRLMNVYTGLDFDSVTTREVNGEIACKLLPEIYETLDQMKKVIGDAIPSIKEDMHKEPCTSSANGNPTKSCCHTECNETSKNETFFNLGIPMGGINTDTYDFCLSKLERLASIRSSSSYFWKGSSLDDEICKVMTKLRSINL